MTTPHPNRIPLEGCTIEPHPTRRDYALICWPDGTTLLSPALKAVVAHGVKLPPRPVVVPVTLTPEERDHLALQRPIDYNPTFAKLVEACRASKAAEQ